MLCMCSRSSRTRRVGDANSIENSTKKQGIVAKKHFFRASRRRTPGQDRKRRTVISTRTRKNINTIIFIGIAVEHNRKEQYQISSFSEKTRFVGKASLVARMSYDTPPELPRLPPCGILWNTTLPSELWNS